MAGTPKSTWMPLHLEFQELLDLHRKLLYWCGLLNVDSTHDQHYFTSLFKPRVVEFLYRHDRLLQVILLFQRNVTWAFVVLFVIMDFILLPISMYRNWEDKSIVLECISTLQSVVVHLPTLLHMGHNKSRLANIFNSLEKTSSLLKINNMELMTHVRKIVKRYKSVTTIIIFKIMPILAIVACIFTAFLFYPNRRLHLRIWFPACLEASPAFEMMLISMLLLGLFDYYRSCIIILAGGTLILVSVMIFKAIKTNIANINSNDIIKEWNYSANFGMFHTTNCKGFPLHNNTAENERRESDTSFNRSGKTRERAPATGEIPIETGTVEIPIETETVVIPIERAVEIEERQDSVAGTSSDFDLLEKNSYPMTVNCIEMEVIEATVQHRQNSTNPHENRLLQNYLKTCVLTHAQVLRTVHEVNEIFKFTFTGVMLINIVFLGIFAVVITTDTLDIAIKIGNASMFIVASAALFIFCYAGNVLTDQAESVCEAIYDADWFETSMTVKKSLMIMMTMATKPLYLKPVGYDPLSVKLHGEVVSGSYKFLTTYGKVMY